MVQKCRFSYLYSLLAIILFAFFGKANAQCPVVPAYSFAPSCQADFEINFTNTSTAPGGLIDSYLWDFGDGTTSTATDPTHIFPGAGTYSVYLFVFDTSGCYDSVPHNVVASQLPVSAFTADTACLGETTHFTDLSQPTGQILNWLWDFGDGNTSSLQNPTHTYALDGTYSVTLSVTDLSGCSNTIVQDVSVEALPLANFSFITEHCVGETVFFDDMSHTTNGFITMWVWDFGDGTGDTIYYPSNPDIEHIYQNPGQYTVTLTITNSLGCMASVPKPITIHQVPLAAFDYLNACEDMPVYFIDMTSQNGGGQILSWLWNFGDPLSGATNTSMLQNPNHLFSGPGAYNVTLIVWNVNACIDTSIQTVIVQPKPPVDFYNDPSCEGGITQFYVDQSVVNVSTITTYLWDFDDGNFSNLQNPVHLYAGFGTYNVTLTITDTSLCENSITKPVVVDQLPVAFFDITEPNCSEDSVFFDDLSSTGVGYIQTWVWDFDDGSPNVSITFPDDPNVYHIYANPGTYGATVTVTNSQGCTHSFLRNVEILPKPIANFHWSANACQDEEVQFTDASFPNGQGNILSWYWDFDDPISGIDNTSTLQNPVHIFTQGGMVYYVSLIVSNFNDCIDTIVKPVFVNETPDVAFLWEVACEDTLTYFYPDSSIMDISSIVTWLWDFGDGQFSTEQSPAHNYENIGYYDVTLTVSDTGVCTNSLTQEIFINASPVANFDISEITCMNSPVYFADLSSVANSFIVEWHWDFGDGNDTTIYFPDDPDVEHTYALHDTYLVTLSVVSDDACYGTISEYLVIDPAPIALFNYDPACYESLTQFWDNSNMGGGLTIISWYWDFGDPNSAPNNTSTLQNPLHDFTNPGVYNVTLTVTNVDGCTNTIIQQVTVNEGAAIDFYSMDTCYSFYTQFYVDLAITDTLTILLYDWDFGDGSLHSNLMNPAHMYYDPGIYDVSLIILDTSGCSNAVSHVVEVWENPIALFEYETACTQDSTYFFDLSYAPSGDPIISWEWNFDDPASGANNISTLPYPAHVFTGGTIYNVKLVIETNHGCKDSVMIPITVYIGPESDFTYNAEYCQSGQVYFSDASTITQSVIVEWEWYFEPGSYSYIPNPTHYFQETNTIYYVSLKVTDANGCSSEIVQAVYVPDAFEIEMHYTQTCVFDAMSFSVTILQPAGDSIFSYSWNFGDPSSGPHNISHIAEPIHTYNSPGYYTVTLTAIDIHGCPLTIYGQVYVDELPEPAFAYENILCDSIIYFTDLSFGNGAPVTSWLWDFGDGSPPQHIVIPPGNTHHFYEYEGIYTVTLTVVNGLGCEDSVSMEVEREPCVHADFFVVNSPVCERNNIYFADESGIENLIKQWHWDFGDGSDTIYYSKSDLISHYYEAAGDFDVSLIVSALFSGQVISDTLLESVTIHPSPVTEFICDPVCFGEPSLFYDLTEHPGFFIASWHWDFGTGIPGDTADYKNPVFAYDTAGTFDVTLITVNQYGCSDSLTQEVRVNYTPIAEFEHTIACKGNQINFTDLSDGFDANIIAWDWYFNDPFLSGDTADVQDPHWTYAEQGTYTTRLVVKNENGCLDTAFHDVIVNTVPVASFKLFLNQANMQGSILLKDQSVDAIEHLWNFGDGYELWGNVPPVTHVYEEEGAYEVSLVVWNEFGCPDTAFKEIEFMFKTLYIPNALAPSSNDPEVMVFQPKGRNLHEYYIAVHDSWGNLLWESEKLDSGGRPVESWDGTYDGKLMPTDVYIWQARAVFKDGTFWEGNTVGNTDGGSGSTSGTVILIR
jgi:PKD repeat protein